MIFISQPNEPHRLKANPKGLMMYWLFFRFPAKGKNLLGLPSAESAWLERALRHFPNRLFDGTDRVRHAFVRLFLLYDTLAANSARRRLSMRSTSLELLLALIEAAEVKPHHPNSSRIAPLIQAMRKHPERDYPMDDLLRQSALSPCMLARLFKQATGLPPHSFLLGCRIRRAQGLLQSTRQSISRIAADLNFASPQHFAMHFKRETGITPTAWRQKHGAQPSS